MQALAAASLELRQRDDETAMTMWSRNLDGAGRMSFIGALRGWLRPFVLVLVLALGARWIFLVLEPPGEAIRDDLAAAAADIGRLPWSAPPESVRRAIALRFPYRDVVVDPAGFPVYAKVTLLHLDKAACLDVAVAARRIEGSVVVALSAYAAPEDCRDDNAMTWRLMP